MLQYTLVVPFLGTVQSDEYTMQHMAHAAVSRALSLGTSLFGLFYKSYRDEGVLFEDLLFKEYQPRVEIMVVHYKCSALALECILSTVDLIISRTGVNVELVLPESEYGVALRKVQGYREWGHISIWSVGSSFR